MRGLARLISSAISNWQNTGPGTKRKLRRPFGLVQHLGADDVGRHQVGGELHALGGEAEHGAERFHQPGLAQAGHADQQRVAAGQQRDQRLIDHLVLAEDDAADRGAHGGDARAERLDLGEDCACCGQAGCPREPGASIPAAPCCAGAILERHSVSPSLSSGPRR